MKGSSVRFRHRAPTIKEYSMSKMTDLLKKALDKKKGIYHPENADAPQAEKKVNKASAPAPSKKPPTRSAGRGR